MLTGINANIQHEGRSYHIQTEDGGIEHPVITTLLFQEGAILSSKKTHYRELLESDALEETVKRLMETQHKEMVLELVGAAPGSADPEAAPASSTASSTPLEPDAAAIQGESSSPQESHPLGEKSEARQEKKGLDALIQDYLANQKARGA